MKLHFLGANRQVTGSRYLLEATGLKILIDCGLVQERKYVGRNWEPPAFDPASLDIMLLTHAHLDHVGLTPRLVAQGFNKTILTTEPSVDLAEIIMLDSARIQEEDASYKKKRHRKENRRGKYPEEPLYTPEDAQKAVRLLKGVEYGHPQAISDDVSVTFHDAGHILGSAVLEINVKENGHEERVVFSGDLGQWDKPIIDDPSLLTHADHVVMESTYGDRSHREGEDVDTQLAKIVFDTYKRGGNLVIPTFAVERAQELIYHLGNLSHDERIPKLPVFLDSPMASDVTEVFRKHRRYFDDETWAMIDAGKSPLNFDGLTFSRTVKDSKAIAKSRGPKIIMSTSGMCTAGRIKHHLRQNIEDPKSTILFVGYQGHGTLGRIIIDGDRKVRIHGKHYEVKAHRTQVYGFSAHADREDLLRWIGHFDPSPKNVFLTHGDEEAAESLASAMRASGNMNASVPAYGDVVNFTPPSAD